MQPSINNYKFLIIITILIPLIISSCSPISSTVLQPTSTIPALSDFQISPTVAILTSTHPIATQTPFATQTPLPYTTPTSKSTETIEFPTSFTIPLTQPLVGITFSPDNTLVGILTSGSSFQIYRLWQSEVLLDVRTDGQITYMTFSPDNKQLALALDGITIQIYNLSEGVLQKSWSDQDTVSNLGFSSTGTKLISFAPTQSERLRIWNIDEDVNLNFQTNLEGAFVTQATFSLDGDLLAVGYSLGVIQLWHVPTGVMLKSVEAHSDWVVSLSFSPSGLYLASDSLSSDPAVKVWNIPDCSLVTVLEDDNWDPGFVQFSPNGDLLASLSYSAGGINLWQVRDWTLFDTVLAYQVVFQQNGALVAFPLVSGYIVFQITDKLLQDYAVAPNARGIIFPPQGMIMSYREEDSQLVFEEVRPAP